MHPAETLIDDMGSLHAVFGPRRVDHHLAEDLCGTAVLKCLEVFKRTGVLPPRGYLIKTGLHAHISWARRKRPERMPDGFDQVWHGNEPSTEAENREVVDRVRRELAMLPYHYRIPMELRMQGLDPAEIARRMGTKRNTVNTRLNRARLLIRERLRRAGLD